MTDLFANLDDTQDAHLARVAGKIAEAIVAFCRQHATFRMDELRRWVEARVPSTAPDSPSRVLRMLRRDGWVSYKVVSRRDSLYEVTRVEP